MILKASIEKLLRGENLLHSNCQRALEAMLDPLSNPLQIAALLMLLRAKQETAEELSAFISFLRARMIKVLTDYPVLDLVGTGGDGLNTVNISTGSAILAASCGVKIAKHGNSSFSSLTGSADVLTALGVNIHLTPRQISASIAEIGIGFCYAPNFHPLLQSLSYCRKALNVPTTFNIIGPLLNPANAAYLILGVAHETLLPIMAEVLINCGISRAAIVHGMGLDEISCVGVTQIIEINGQEKFVYTLDPLKFGLPRCQIKDLRGGDAKANAELLLAAFNGKQGPIADTLILNAAVALYLYGLHSSINTAVTHVTNNLYSGAVLKLLNNWIEFSND